MATNPLLNMLGLGSPPLQTLGLNGGANGATGEPPSYGAREMSEQPPPEGAQLVLPEREMDRLGMRIEEDRREADQKHDERKKKFARYFSRWRGTFIPPGGTEGKSNFPVRVTTWQVFARWAREVESLLGDDAEIVADPVGPTDQGIVAKVGRYMTWLMFTAMKISRPLTVFIFRKIMYGRAHGYAPYEKLRYLHPTKGPQVYYEGPGFHPIHPDDLIVPAEEAMTIQEFSFVIRRYHATPADIRRGEGTIYLEGMTGDEESWKRLNEVARQNYRRGENTSGDISDEMRREQDVAEGVDRETAAGLGTSAQDVEVWEWYSKWRLPLKEGTGNREQGTGEEEIETEPREEYVDCESWDILQREREETEVVVRYIPAMHKVIGIQRLDELYPDTPNRRPIVEAAMTYDGTYWPPSLPELIEAIEEEATVNNNLATEGGQYTVGPIILYRPASGFNPEKFKIEPGIAIPTEDPEGVRVITFNSNLEYPIMQQQNLLAMSERLTGQSDFAMGRGSDRPNAPRTARATIALMTAGDVRVSLDIRMLREDLGAMVGWFWDLTCMYAPASQFFRVTEEEAGGLFEVNKGFGEITAKERAGKFDFDIKFATGALSKEARKELVLALFTLAIQTPLFMSDLRAQWMLINELFKVFGFENFAQFIQRPPEMANPLDPREEWTRALQGEKIYTHRMDDDDKHIEDHRMRVKMMMADKMENQDQSAMSAMITHIGEHEAQKLQKQIEQAQAMMAGAVASALGAQIGEQTAGAADGLAAQGGPPQMPGMGQRAQMPMPRMAEQPEGDFGQTGGLPPMG